MKIKLIAAIDKQMGIGKNNDLPWPRLRGDLKFFKEQTFQKPILMGRKTFESIGKPLPARTNLVLTSRDFIHDDVETFKDTASVLLYASSQGWDTMFIIGGSSVYKEFLPFCSEILLTEVDASFDCDTHFPEFDRSLWSEEVVGSNCDHDINYTHLRLVRK
jgi:dihydrofolate reductase